MRIHAGESDELKRCSKCRVIKPFNNFNRNVGMRFNLHPQCRECLGFKTRRPKRTLNERLDHYSIPEPNSGCWLWFGAGDDLGYGNLWGNNKLTKVHRLQWERFNGYIPSGLEVCHKCDTPACINPDHLFLGTHKENMRDSVLKGRNARGERNGRTTLTEKQALAIRNDLRPAKIVGLQYGVGAACVRQIRRGVRWIYLNKPPPPSLFAQGNKL